MLPLTYAVRNAFRVPARSAQVAFGVGLVVALLLSAAGFTHGMQRLLAATGSPDNMILLGAGSEESVERSEISAAVPGIASSVRGVVQRFGQPAVSGEVHYNGSVEIAGKDPHQALLRGVTAAALEVHPEVRLLRGRFPGTGEVMVGRLAPRYFGVDAETLQPGATLRFEGLSLTVSGVFEAPGTVMESELWMPLQDLMTTTQRDTLSCTVLRMEGAHRNRVKLFAAQRLDLELSAISEQAYYAGLSNFYGPIRLMVWLTAGMVAAGALFGGLNTLYAAYTARMREFASLQAIGFGRLSLLWSLLQESLLVAAMGTLGGVTVVLATLDGRAIPFFSGVFEMYFSPSLVAGALGAGLLMGLVGALPPAWVCLARDLPQALRSD